MTTQTTLPPQGSSLLRRTWGPVAVGAGGLALVAALAVRDPHVPGAWGTCIFFDATGLWCPGCGGLRAVNDLVHLDVAGALSSNAMGVVLIGLLAAWWGLWAWSAASGRTLPWERWVTPARAYLGLGVVLAFSVLRNLPGFEALGP